MTDDIVKYLRLSQTRFNRHAEAADEIERLQNESDLWRNTCRKLIGMMLPYSLLMRDDERKELAIIFKEAVDDR